MIQDEGYRINDTGWRIHNEWCRINDTRHKIQDAEHMIKDTWYRIKDTGNNTSKKGYEIKNTLCSLQYLEFRDQLKNNRERMLECKNASIQIRWIGYKNVRIIGYKNVSIYKF